MKAGINGVNKEISGGFIGINGANRKLTEIWAGVNGVNKQLWKSAFPMDIGMPDPFYEVVNASGKLLAGLTIVSDPFVVPEDCEIYADYEIEYYEEPLEPSPYGATTTRELIEIRFSKNSEFVVKQQNTAMQSFMGSNNVPYAYAQTYPKKDFNPLESRGTGHDPDIHGSVFHPVIAAEGRMYNRSLDNPVVEYFDYPNPMRKMAFSAGDVFRLFLELTSIKRTTIKLRLNSIDGPIAMQSTIHLLQEAECYLTTAMVHHYGLQDNGKELTAMRSLREKYAEKHAETLKEYGTVSRYIINGIEASGEKERWYAEIKQDVDKVVTFVSMEQWENAEQTYLSLYKRLKQEFHEGGIKHESIQL